MVEFIESLGTWVEESILKRLQKAAMYSLMADECTDIANVEELSVFCRWEEGGVPVECFLEVIPLKKADAETIYSTLIECLKKKNLQVGRIVGLGFDRAATFSGRRTGVQARIKKHTLHALFVHCWWAQPSSHDQCAQAFTDDVRSWNIIVIWQRRRLCWVYWRGC